MNGIDLKNFGNTNLSSEMKFAAKNELNKSTVNMNFQTEANLSLNKENLGNDEKSKKKKKKEEAKKEVEKKKSEEKVVTDIKKIMNII